ncbi:MAG: hypothetical protein OES57_15075 [Acidimicrobiia bacterium]|nr:hypothetical protein [Acidimicrobiia bacterium]
MNDTVRIVMVGGIGLAVAALGRHRRHHGHHPRLDHRRAGHGCGGHHHGGHDHLRDPQWQGLTEDEARAKLTDRLHDQADVDAAVDELDTRGYLAGG